MRHLLRVSGARSRAARLLAAALTASGLVGCAYFGGEFRDSSAKWSAMFHWRHEDPLVVLRDSANGDARAKALRSLQEPTQGGDPGKQDLYVQLLTTAAACEKQALCRIAAITTLSRYRDPRAVQALVEAYYRADAFPPDSATVVRCQALTALGTTGNPAAVDLLAKVVREPPVEGSELDRQQALDVRTAAARALARYNQPQATDALVQVLKTEKDVALRDRAHGALVASTGRYLPPDPKVWEALVHPTAENREALAAAEREEPKLRLAAFFQWGN